MKYRPLLWILLIYVCSSSRISDQLSELMMKFKCLRGITAYRRLEHNLPPQELYLLTSLAIFNGILQTERQLKQHLVQEIKKLVHSSQTNEDNKLIPNIDKLEQEIVRDQFSLSILSNSIDLIGNIKNERQFNQELLSILEQSRLTQMVKFDNQSTTQHQLRELLEHLRHYLLVDVPRMKTDLDSKIKYVLKKIINQTIIDGPLSTAIYRIYRKREVNSQKLKKLEHKHFGLHMVKPNFTKDKLKQNFVKQQYKRSKSRKENQDLKDNIDNNPMEVDPQNQFDKTKANGNQDDGDEFSDFEENEGNNEDGSGSGIVGIIESLSGGGSDVGAFIGAITGVISTLFGPGGLDIESLIGTATSLISGLLSTDMNFGVVLGNYVGIAFDGLSGGGGAINNGKFLGNFLGTVLAELSADPEEEGHPQPLTFTKSFIHSFIESKHRPYPEQESEERYGNTNLLNETETSGVPFSSKKFAKQISSHLWSSTPGTWLKASLNALIGSFQSFSSLVATSSH